LLISSDKSNQPNLVDSKKLADLFKTGFKLTPLDDNHIPAVEEWTSIYENPSWRVENFDDPKVYSKFKNVAIELEKTHPWDPACFELDIQVLHIDSRNANNLANKL
jgi:hypothetical protein